MMSKDEILKMFYSRLAEIQHYQREDTDMIGTNTYEVVLIELELLYNILGEDVPEEYWEQTEDALYFNC